MLEFFSTKNQFNFYHQSFQIPECKVCRRRLTKMKVEKWKWISSSWIILDDSWLGKRLFWKCFQSAFYVITIIINHLFDHKCISQIKMNYMAGDLCNRNKIKLLLIKTCQTINDVCQYFFLKTKINFQWLRHLAGIFSLKRSFSLFLTAVRIRSNHLSPMRHSMLLSLFSSDILPILPVLFCCLVQKF